MIDKWDNLYQVFTADDWHVFDNFMYTLGILALQHDTHYVERAGGQGVCS